MLQFSNSKKFVILLTVLLGFMFASPNVLPPSVLNEMPDWYPRDTINLGLDLQGGTYVLLEVDVTAVRAERINGLADEVRVILRNERIRFTGLQVSGDGWHRRGHVVGRDGCWRSSCSGDRDHG